MSSVLRKGIVGNSDVFASKGQIVIGQVTSRFAFGGSEDPRPSAGGVCPRMDMGLLGGSVDFHTLTETVVHLKTVVSRCIEWIDLG